MGFIPLFLQVKDQPCLVIGGGEVAARKVHPLLDAGARVTLISPNVSAELATLAEAGRISYSQRPYRRGDMEGYCLVYAATDDRQLQRLLFKEARDRNILINVADAPEFCSFIVPSVIRRGRLQIAISTEGASPAAARMLRQKIAGWLGDEIEVFLELMAGARAWLKVREPDSAARARKLNTLAAAGLPDALHRRDLAQVERILTRCLGGGVTLADLNLEAAIIRNPQP